MHALWSGHGQNTIFNLKVPGEGKIPHRANRIVPSVLGHCYNLNGTEIVFTVVRLLTDSEVCPFEAV